MTKKSIIAALVLCAVGYAAPASPQSTPEHLGSNVRYVRANDSGKGAPITFFVQHPVTGRHGFSLYGFSADGSSFALEDFGSLIDTGDRFYDLTLYRVPGTIVLDRLTMRTVLPRTTNNATTDWLKRHGISPQRPRVLAVRPRKHPRSWEVVLSPAQSFVLQMEVAASPVAQCAKRGGTRLNLSARFRHRFYSLATNVTPGGGCRSEYRIAAAFCAKNVLGVVIGITSPLKGNYTHVLLTTKALDLAPFCTSSRTMSGKRLGGF